MRNRSTCDGSARGAAPGRGRELVATESDYACVIDGDVLVLRLGDREVAPTPELVRAFDGDVETVYDADYRKPEPVKDLRGASVSSSRYQNFRDAIDVPNPYVTTYKTAFTPQSRFLEDSPPKDKMAAHYTCPHGAATTTYRAMFAGREPRDFHDSILEEPSILRRFVAPGVGRAVLARLPPRALRGAVAAALRDDDLPGPLLGEAHAGLAQDLRRAR